MLDAEKRRLEGNKLPTSSRRTLARLCLAALLAALLSGALAQSVELSGRAFELARQLRCPVCTAESVADSNSEVSVEMRQQIQALLEEGRSDAEILSYFQARYGDWILLEPPKRGLHLLVWLLPAAAALFGALLLALVVRRWLHRARTPVTLDESERARVREAMGGER